MDRLIKAGMPYLSSRGITPESAERFVLTYDDRQDAILIPYFDAVGNFRGASQRNLKYQKGVSYPPKYYWPPGPRHLYNVEDADRPLVYLTEGEFDCIILKQLGLDAVGVPGVNNFRVDWSWLFADHTVFLCFDADPPIERGGKIIRPGQDAMQRLRRSLARVTDDIHIVALPEGEDITSLFVDGKLEEVLPLP